LHVAGLHGLPLAYALLLTTGLRNREELMAEQNNDSLNNSNINDFINEAEERVRKGAAILNEWGAKAGDLLQKQPAVVLVGVAVLGFATGLLLRRAAISDEE
jgi:hypothetical protein